MTNEELLKTAERLAQAWIEEERERNKLLEKVRRAGGSASALSMSTSQLKQCRRELQIAFGLISVREDLKEGDS